MSQDNNTDELIDELRELREEILARRGGKTDVIPLNYKACQALKTWLKVRPQVDHDALLVTKFKNPMGPRAIQRMVKKYMEGASRDQRCLGTHPQAHHGHPPRGAGYGSEDCA